MPSQYSSGKHAIAECDRCGFRYKLKELKSLVIKTKNVNILVCQSCWEPDQPQLSLGLYPVNDPQAVRNPRPDTSYYVSGVGGDGGSRDIFWGWDPVGISSSVFQGTANPSIGVGGVGVVSVEATINPTPPVPPEPPGPPTPSTDLIGIKFQLAAVPVPHEIYYYASPPYPTAFGEISSNGTVYSIEFFTLTPTQIAVKYRYIGVDAYTNISKDLTLTLPNYGTVTSGAASSDTIGSSGATNYYRTIVWNSVSGSLDNDVWYSVNFVTT